MNALKQKQRLIDYMEKYGAVNRGTAFTQLGIANITARICELRKSGVNVKGKTVYTTNIYGDRTHYTNYYLED